MAVENTTQPDPPTDAAPAAQTPADELAALRQDVEQLRDKNLRLTAELRNVTQRAQRDKEEALRFAEGDFARELLVVIDDLERTLDAAASSNAAGPVVEGVRITYEHFLKVLRNHHIQQIEAIGKPFDPHLHEALMQQPSTEHPPGTVTQELARGYTMHNRVIRPARVAVAASSK